MGTVFRMLYRFIVLNGPGKGEQSTLPVDELVIGRGEECGLHLDDPEVAAKHARVTHTAQGPHISDLGSMNRILVNKREVREAALKHGDVIEIGRTQLLLQAYLQADITEESAPSEPRPSVRRSIRVAAWAAILLGFWAAYQIYAPSKPPAPAPETAQPGTPSAKPAPDSSAASSAAVSEELRQLREELASIKSAFQGMASATPPSVSPPPPAAPEPGPEATDLNKIRLAASERELEAARKSIESGELDRADMRLERLQMEDPDFLPAYAERARLFERRGELQRAIGQWAQLIQRSRGGTMAGRAAEEWVRLAATQAATAQGSPASAPEAPPPKAEPASPPAPEPAPPAAAAAPEPPRALILDLSQRRFPDSPDYDEMRVIRIDLASPGRKPPDPRTLRLEVSLFDCDGDGAPYLTRVMHPTYVLESFNASWNSVGEMSLSVPYVVPRGLRPAGATERFYGYVARLYCDGKLQDQNARPLDLLEPPAAAPSVEIPDSAQAESSASPAASDPSAGPDANPTPPPADAPADAPAVPKPEAAAPRPPDLPERAP